MRFYPHSVVSGSRGTVGALWVLKDAREPDTEINWLWEQNRELRMINQHLRQEVKKLRKAVGER